MRHETRDNCHIVGKKEDEVKQLAKLGRCDSITPETISLTHSLTGVTQCAQVACINTGAP